MLWRISFVLLITIAAASGQGAEKPSPVPSRAQKDERARASNREASHPSKNSLSPESNLPAVNWKGPQYGSSVFFSSREGLEESMEPLSELIAAHASLPLGSLVRVTNMQNGKEVIVKIVNRIPAASEHIISVSDRAARDLDFRRYGVGSVRLVLAKP